MGQRLRNVLNWTGFICLIYVITFFVVYGIGVEAFNLKIPWPAKFFIALFFVKLIILPVWLLAQYMLWGKVTILPWRKQTA